jgi:hypothetical protein
MWIRADGEEDTPEAVTVPGRGYRSQPGGQIPDDRSEQAHHSRSHRYRAKEPKPHGTQAAENRHERGEGHHQPEAVKRCQRLNRRQSAPRTAQGFPKVAR